MKNLFFILLIPFILDAQVKDKVAVKYAETITKTELSQHLHEIASDNYEGRETGMIGQKMAAAYLAGEFNSYGIQPFKGSYFQKFPLILQYAYGVDVSSSDSSFKWMRDFYYWHELDNKKVDIKEIAFIGYGISNDKYNDYTNIDVSGKGVIFYDGEPSKKGSLFLSEAGLPSEWSMDPLNKINFAIEKGARAIFIVKKNHKEIVGNESYQHYMEEPKMLLNKTLKDRLTVPVLYISEDMAKALTGGLLDFDKTLAKINKKGKAKSSVHTLSKTFYVDVNRQNDNLTSENVLAFIEGSDLKNEVVVITAHYDHIGKNGDEIFNGADDDGSGTVALLEIAEAFQIAKREGKGPRRSILIMPVSGEEKGLLGSEFYSDHPLLPLRNTVANLNIDMIGRMDENYKGDPNYIYLIGSDILSQDLHDISEQANKTYSNLKLDYRYNDLNDPNRFYYRSDHYNFAKHNIPCIFYFNGVHEDYHQSSDTVEKIDFEKIEKISRLIFYTAWDLVNRDERIKLNTPVVNE
ncbi:M28 family peptidase [Flavobacteriales bacterium]|jgi:hypothetical protein|nr:M28 family peptidase [Flavobacteriales bacterium]